MISPCATAGSVRTPESLDFPDSALEGGLEPTGSTAAYVQPPNFTHFPLLCFSPAWGLLLVQVSDLNHLITHENARSKHGHSLRPPFVTFWRRNPDWLCEARTTSCSPHYYQLETGEGLGESAAAVEILCYWPHIIGMAILTCCLC